MDEMKIKSGFMKAILSTVICRFLKSKGIDIDISIVEFEVTRKDEDKKLKLVLKAEGECTDDQLTSLVSS